MVWEALVEQGVPLGSQIVIVGHSFGSDTALDLASDPSFNGPQGFDVTHVVAAGYDSQPQLDDIPDRTNVLVLQNRDDVPVLVESVEHAADAAARGRARDRRRRRRPRCGRRAGRRVRRGLASRRSRRRAGVAPRHACRRCRRRARGTATCSMPPRTPCCRSLAPSATATRRSTSCSTVVGADFGHDQHHYVDYLASTSDPLVLGFLGSLATGTAVAGHGGRGRRVGTRTARTACRKLESPPVKLRPRPVVPSSHGPRPQEVDRQDPGGVRRRDRPRQVASQSRAHARPPAGRARRSRRHDRRSRARQARPVAGHGARQGDRAPSTGSPVRSAATSRGCPASSTPSPTAPSSTARTSRTTTSRSSTSCWR